MPLYEEEYKGQSVHGSFLDYNLMVGNPEAMDMAIKVHFKLWAGDESCGMAEGLFVMQSEILNG